MKGIGIGSRTSTGGIVIEGNQGITLDGLTASSIGHKATCPACKKGIGKIVAAGPRTTIYPAGPAARTGDYVACGCPTGKNVLTGNSSVIIDAAPPHSLQASTSAPNASSSELASNSTELGPPKAQQSDTQSQPLNNAMDEVRSQSHFSAIEEKTELYVFQLESTEHQLRQIAFLPVEGVGVNGVYFIRTSLRLNGKNLHISAMGFTPAQRSGTIRFHASAALRINGIETESISLIQANSNISAWPKDEYMPIGSASLALPSPAKNTSAQIIITGGYTYQTRVGSAVPMPSSGELSIPLSVVKSQ